MKLFLVLAFTITAAAQTLPLHINAGGPATSIYQADAFYTGGTPYLQSVAPNPGESDFWKTVRGGNFFYKFNVPDGAYTVTLHFRENSASVTSVGQRIFDVAINGTKVLASFDMLAVTFFNNPINRDFPVVATGGTGITITFTTIVRNAIVDAIDVVAVPVVVPPTDPYPGVHSDGKNGLIVDGTITYGTGLKSSTTYAGSINIGTTGFVGPTTNGTVIFLELPTGDGTDTTSMPLYSKGVVPCGNLAPDVLASNPTCIKLAFGAVATGTGTGTTATCDTCTGDGSYGLIVGGFRSGTSAGQSGSVLLRGGQSGGVGIAAPAVSGSGTGTAPLDASSPSGDFIMLLAPVGTPSGTLGVQASSVPCPPMLPMTESMHPVCYQLIWK